MDSGNQLALVTGASSGIGRQTALRLAQEGMQVIAVARREERLAELAAGQAGIRPMKVDLADRADTARFCGEIAALPQAVTVLVNNAGYSLRGALEDIPLPDVRRLFEVNFFSLLQVAQAVLPAMRRQRQGTIVNLSSLVGKLSFPFGGAYAASKYAVEALSDALRLELRPFGIRVVTIRPGVVATEFNEVAGAMSGDAMARSHDDYQPVYQAVGAGVGAMFSGIDIPGPETIADLIVEAVRSPDPGPSYAAGPFIDDVLAQRFALGDRDFDRYWAEKTGLSGLKV